MLKKAIILSVGLATLVGLSWLLLKTSPADSIPYTTIKEKPSVVKHPTPNPERLKQGKAYLFFSEYLYPQLRRNECGKCRSLTHYDKKDRGGVTLIGISIKSNPEWFVNTLNAFAANCKPHFTGNTICNLATLETMAKKHLFKKYTKPFAGCGQKAMLLLVDSSVLSGDVTAIKLLQRSRPELKEDGVLGKNTLKYCQDDTFDGVAFTDERVKRFPKLKTYKDHGIGWGKRAFRMLNIWKKL